MSRDKTKQAELVKTSAGQCVWVDAGVLSYKLCTLGYDCEHCSLHRALVDGPSLVNRDQTLPPNRAQGEQRRHVFAEFFRRLPASARRCRYMLTGDVSYKLCINAFHCATCSFNQMMEDLADQEADLPMADTFSVDGVQVPPELHYHRAHTWVRLERGGDVRVGLDDFGQWLLGSVRGVRLPEVGERIFEGSAACELTLADHREVSPLAPMSGEVTARNERLIVDPGLLNTSPYSAGWLFTLRACDFASDLVSLLRGEEARRWIARENQRAGGVAARDRKQWKEDLLQRMVSEFLFVQLERAA